jgi:hypothetical protein
MANETKVYIANKSYTVSQAARMIKSNGANVIVPKGVDDADIMIRFVARDHAGNDKVFGACAIEDFAKINMKLEAI